MSRLTDEQHLRATANWLGSLPQSVSFLCCSMVDTVLLHDAMNAVAMQEWNVTSTHACSDVKCVQGWQYAAWAFQVNAQTQVLNHESVLKSCTLESRHESAAEL